MTWASIAKAAVPSLVQGLFGSRKAKAQGVDYQKLRDDAQAAGFNPMTALLAGGGAGYQREFNPELASGAFIAEAVSRGLDTYYNTPSAADLEAQRLRERVNAETLYEASKTASLPSNFGYSLAETQPFVANSSVSEPEFANSPAASGRPPVNPLDRDPSYIPVRHPDGRRGQLEVTIAERMGIKPFATVSAGDWAEIVGELGGEAEMALGTEKVRDTAIARPIFAAPGYLGRDRDRRRQRAAEASAKTRKWSRGAYWPQYQFPQFSQPWGTY